MTPGQISPASLRLVVQADSLEETGADFTDQQKQIINKEVKDIVLQPAQYPEIVFQSTAVTSKPIGSGEYALEIVGDLTLHGVTKRITIPTKLIYSDVYSAVIPASSQCSTATLRSSEKRCLPA